MWVAEEFSYSTVKLIVGVVRVRLGTSKVCNYACVADDVIPNCMNIG